MLDPQRPSQEAKVRQRLISEGYVERYGTNDADIRRRLKINGPCADFVGFHPQRGMWLVAESKDGNLERAEQQLANTLQGLLVIEPEALEAVELRIYMNEQQYSRLLREGLAGYLLVEGFLGFMQEMGFEFTLIQGIRVRIEVEGQQ